MKNVNKNTDLNFIGKIINAQKIADMEDGMEINVHVTMDIKNMMITVIPIMDIVKLFMEKVMYGKMMTALIKLKIVVIQVIGMELHVLVIQVIKSTTMNVFQMINIVIGFMELVMNGILIIITANELKKIVHHQLTGMKPLVNVNVNMVKILHNGTVELFVSKVWMIFVTKSHHTVSTVLQKKHVFAHMDMMVNMSK